MKSRIGKTTWLILSVGTFLIALASLGFAYWQQLKEQEQLAEQLNLAAQELNALPTEQLFTKQTALKEDLLKLEADSTVEKNYLEQPIDCMSTVDALYSIANNTGLAVVEVNVGEIAVIEMEDVTFDVLSSMIRVDGDPAKIADYIAKLSQKFTTGIVKDVQIDIRDDPEQSSAVFKLEILSYKGG